MKCHYAAGAAVVPFSVGPDGYRLFELRHEAACGARSAHGLNVTGDPAAVTCDKCRADL